MLTNRAIRTERMIDEWDADGRRRAAERLARYNANPELYAQRRRQAGLPAGPPRGAVHAAAERAEARSRGTEAPYEPSQTDLAEMHSAWTIGQITDFCRALRTSRENPEAFKQAWNLAAQSTGVPLKMIAWAAWGRQ